MSTRVRLGSAAKKISSWVRPGVCEVRASELRPVSALIRLDLPTLERPANAISMPRILGSDSSELAAVAKSHGCANKRRPASRSAAENSDAVLTPVRLKHFPAKWEPVRRRKCDNAKNLEHAPCPASV